MFQVVVQSAIRNLKSRLKLPPQPSVNDASDKPPEKDKTGFILIIFLMASVFLLFVFGNIGK